MYDGAIQATDGAQKVQDGARELDGAAQRLKTTIRECRRLVFPNLPRLDPTVRQSVPLTLYIAQTPTESQ